jgi:adenosylcobinamide-phosphate synthase
VAPSDLDGPLGTIGIVVAALAIDRVLGEPAARFHPVVWMGSLTARLVRTAPAGGAMAQLLYGTAIAIAVPAVAALVTAVALHVLASFGRGLEEARAVTPGLLTATALVDLAARAWILKTLFAVRALGDAAGVVRAALARQDLAGARRGLGSLCSRDPSALDAPALTAATVESVAENASDSIVAPLACFLVLGLPATAFYRAVNTMDAMIGYRGRFEYLGKAAARLDDLLNFVPARLTALLLLAGGWIAGADVRRGWLVLRRDGGRTESPNAGRPMAAMAGLLGVELEKAGHYRLGDPIEPLAPEKIPSAWRIVEVALITGLLSAAFVLVVSHAG